MARLITDIPNSKNDNPSVYPRGYTPDASGSVAGATGGEAAFGDMIQFFSKLMADTSPAITPNSLPDNETNGYQLFQAFINYVRNVLTATETAKGTVEKATSQEVIDGTSNKFIDAAQFVDKRMFLNPSITSSSTTTFTVTDDYDVYNFTGATLPTVTMPTPVGRKNRLIVLRSTSTYGDNITIANTDNGESQNLQFSPSESNSNEFLPGSFGKLEGIYFVFLSDGEKWNVLERYYRLLG